MRSIAELRKILSHFGCSHKEILSLHIYGNYLYKNTSSNDLDILCVLKNTPTPVKTISQIDQDIRNGLDGETLDLNFVFASELNHYIHGDRPSGYYYSVFHNGVRVYGERWHSKRNIDRVEYYRRIVSLTHRARHSLLNGKELHFWTGKFKKWMIYALAETGYILYNKMDQDTKVTAKKLMKEYPELTIKKDIFEEKENLTMKDYWIMLEKLRLFYENHLLKTKTT